MRHDFALRPVASGSRRMSEAPTTAALVASTRFAHAGTTRFSGAITAIAIAAITTTANEDLRPATGAHEQAARGLQPTGISSGHRRSLMNAEDHRQTAPAMQYLTRTGAPDLTSGLSVGAASVGLARS
ncbi:hypothetical protein AWB68_08802 [Caballeronia choica]|jgi:hypothetical protein|uniref:Uncharacterized protein n=1 Tax=Caballeronia choica TaxID=326476 RepID=A0A158L6Y0_9BURK|nr:hypothetical protein [Caballeronia choica]SAL88521.1 hypothetical protein AWB68_08802 [Caballeronia choica]